MSRHDGPGVDDRQAVAGPFGLVQVVRRHDDGDPGLVAQRPDHVEQVVADAGVQTHRRSEVSGSLDVRSDLVVRGADRVGANLIRFWGPHATLVSQTGADQRVVLGFVDRRLEGALVLALCGDRITQVHAIVDPRKLRFARAQLAELS